MFWAHGRFGEWAKGGLISPLDPSPERRTKIDDFAWEAVSIDGKVYGYPITSEAVSLIYNKDLLPDGPPKTFEEMAALDTPLKQDGRSAILWAYETPYFSYPLLSASDGYAFRHRRAAKANIPAHAGNTDPRDFDAHDYKARNLFEFF
jgi:maltose/maltodextrin transport system substrate-binding protein